ncbi:glycerol-3-phosphate dehydrogenase [Pleurocapsa sp. PCC 7319]|uniref:glycerol-3-phosphate dehydrogenase n=1 Tax=Pleurocapsa sp. PCC 7319 TaxID=118161 RepID=UPI00034C3D98|nr:glycerol-3-phosphate dehydrogenase [Pleurocapsa sp. PCC 7319]
MRDFAQIQQTDYDVIIIGGGINGAGVARDAALRGLKTILIEKTDFASGSSSWSSRLIHGGFRYLEYFEIPLVRESLKEREVLLHTAPHLVNPLQLTIPVYRDRSRPYWKIWVGMILYDLLSSDKTLPSYQMLPKEKFEQMFRSLDKENLVGGSQYYDGQVNFAERLCLENIISAQNAGATVLNYVEVMELTLKDGRISDVVCKDKLTGSSFTISGRKDVMVVNTAGPWVDRVCERGNKAGKRVSIGDAKKNGGTKGSHVVVDPFPGAPNSSLYVEAKSDGRPFFIISWLGKYLIGTTDLPYKDDIENIKANNDEIDYLLQETNNVIPTANLKRDDVKFTYSGVRPLPNSEGKKPGSITRKHIIFDHRKEGVNNLFTLIGGKLTTYRNVGEEMVDAILKRMKRSPQPCRTDSLPLPGCILPNDRRIQEAITEYGSILSTRTIDHLFTIYGAKALEILTLTKDNPELCKPVSPDLPDIKAQIVYAVERELAHTIVDILRRRTTLSMNGNYGMDLLPVVTEVLQKHCGWTQEQCDRACDEYRFYMEHNCIPDYQLA